MPARCACLQEYSLSLSMFSSASLVHTTRSLMIWGPDAYCLYVVHYTYCSWHAGQGTHDGRILLTTSSPRSRVWHWIKISHVARIKAIMINVQPWCANSGLLGIQTRHCPHRSGTAFLPCLESADTGAVLLTTLSYSSGLFVSGRFCHDHMQTTAGR